MYKNAHTFSSGLPQDNERVIIEVIFNVGSVGEYSE